MDILQVGGIIGSGFAAFVGWFKYQRAVKARPIFENGEREAVREALSLIGNSSKTNRLRIEAIEESLRLRQLEIDEELRSHRREHANLLDRTRDLQIQINRLRDEQASP